MILVVVVVALMCAVCSVQIAGCVLIDGGPDTDWGPDGRCSAVCVCMVVPECVKSHWLLV